VIFIKVLLLLLLLLLLLKILVQLQHKIHTIIFARWINSFLLIKKDQKKDVKILKGEKIH
jgi:hypothetical protein